MQITTSDLCLGRVIKAGEVIENIVLLNLSCSEKEAIKRQVTQHEIVLKIKYASIYGDEWLKTTTSLSPK